MIWRDKIRLICLNVKKSAIKNIVSIIEAIIISCVSLFVVGLSSSITKNSHDLVEEFYSDPDCFYSETLRYLCNSTGIAQDIPDGKELKDGLQTVMSNYNESIKYICYFYISNYLFTDPCYYDNMPISFISGGFSDEKGVIYVSRSFQEEYETNNKESLTIGSSIKLYRNSSDVFKVAGIFEVDEKANFEYSAILDFNDQTYYDPRFIEIVFKDDMSFDQIRMVIENIHNKAYTYLESQLSSEFHLALDSQFYNDIQKLQRISLITYSLATLFIVILVLLGVLSICNTSVISIESSFDTVTIYRAYGLSLRDYIEIYMFELIFNIIIAFGLSSLISLNFKQLILNNTISIVNLLFPDYHYGFTYKSVNMSLIFISFVFILIMIMSILVYLKKLLKIYRNKQILRGYQQ